MLARDRLERLNRPKLKSFIEELNRLGEERAAALAEIGRGGAAAAEGEGAFNEALDATNRIIDPEKLKAFGDALAGVQRQLAEAAREAQISGLTGQDRRLAEIDQSFERNLTRMVDLSMKSSDMLEEAHRSGLISYEAMLDGMRGAQTDFNAWLVAEEARVGARGG